EETGVIAYASRDIGFGQRLFGRPRQARDQRQRPRGPVRRCFGRKLQHRSVQPDLANRELRGVDADCQSTASGVDVVPCQRALMDLVELAVGVECERMRGQNGALGDQMLPLGLYLTVMHLTSYPNSGPATANGNCSPRSGAPPKRIR